MSLLEAHNILFLFFLLDSPYWIKSHRQLGQTKHINIQITNINSCSVFLSGLDFGGQWTSFGYKKKAFLQPLDKAVAFQSCGHTDLFLG